jgi:DNA adenine methylase
MKPFLRWAGSKRQMLSELREFIPPSFSRYVEPFAGSARLFFEIAPHASILGDINSELIDTYKLIKINWQEVAQALEAIPPGKESYYNLRSRPLESFSAQERAARFIFLNRFCFNGLYRTNLFGQFNVPYGGDRSGKLPTRVDLEMVSGLLSQAMLVSDCFQETLRLVKRGDFVYMDPPYAKKRERSFTEYSAAGFGDKELCLLRSWMEKLRDSDIKFVVTYADCPEAAILSKGFRSTRVRTRRCISGFVGSRGNVWDVIIRS